MSVVNSRVGTTNVHPCCGPSGSFVQFLTLSVVAPQDPFCFTTSAVLILLGVSGDEGSSSETKDLGEYAIMSSFMVTCLLLGVNTSPKRAFSGGEMMGEGLMEFGVRGTLCSVRAVGLMIWFSTSSAGSLDLRREDIILANAMSFLTPER